MSILRGQSVTLQPHLWRTWPASVPTACCADPKTPSQPAPLLHKKESKPCATQDLADLGPDGVPRMDLLWEFASPRGDGLPVSCLAWNKRSADLLAVGYGASGFDAAVEGGGRGLVAFWSLKNPAHPLWMFETASGVTALDFATYSPNVLAVGLYSGAVAVYDVRSRQGGPSMEADAHNGRHGDPVWK
eukprot:358662-Chlamydomonas_euryale.AAC.2